jgi:hypothetical protein
MNKKDCILRYMGLSISQYVFIYHYIIKEVLMVTIMSLWLPVLVSAVFVFIVSSLIHMVFNYHQNDFGKLAEEDKIMEDLRKYNIPPGEYAMPRAATMKEMSTPEYIEKSNKGPVAMLTVRESGPPKMGASLTLWFVYSVVVGIFAAYVAGRALGPEASYLAVFRFTGVTAFIGYTVAGWQNSIWYNRKWSITIKNTVDGLIYAMVTAGTFGWLWP